MIAKYPNAPINIATTLLSEQFQLKRTEAQEMLKAARENQAAIQKFERDKELKKYESDLKKEEIGVQGDKEIRVAKEKPQLPKEPTPKMYEDIPIGDGTKIQTYKWNPQTQANDIPVGKPKPAWKQGDTDPLTRELKEVRLQKMKEESANLENKMNPKDKFDYQLAKKTIEQSELKKADPLYSSSVKELDKVINRNKETIYKLERKQLYPGWVSTLKNTKSREEAKKIIRKMSDTWPKEEIEKAVKEAGWE